MERRKNLRLPLRLSGQLSLRDGSCQETETSDIGLRGAQVSHAPDGAVDQVCVLNLFVGDAEVSSVTFEGRVVYEDGKGFGIEFESMDAKDFEAFLAFLAPQAENSQVIYREVAQGRTPLLMDWSLFASGKKQRQTRSDDTSSPLSQPSDQQPTGG